MVKNILVAICLVFVASAGPGFCLSVYATEGGKTASVLVDPMWLEQRLADADVRIVELGRTREEYSTGHIPAAVFVDWKTGITDPAQPERYNKLDQEEMESLLGKLGISAGSTVVLYDSLDNRLATRMFWMLRYYGHKNIHILNGGLEAWRRAGNDFVAEIPTFEKTTYHIGRVNHLYSVGMESIRAKLDDPRVMLVDGRPNAQFSGQEPGKVFHTGTEHARRGHIPGAKNIAWKENLNEDGTFKSTDDLRQLYTRAGITKEKTVITYCNEGLHAAMPWFVLVELLDFPKVQLYDDSMSEWANSAELPIAIGK